MNANRPERRRSPDDSLRLLILVTVGLCVACGDGPPAPAPRQRPEAVISGEQSSLSAPNPAAAIGDQRWLDGSGRPNADAREAIALLSAAADEGLDPADYSVDALARLSVALAAPGTPSIERARFDNLLMTNLLQFFRDLHLGRIDPRSLGLRLHVPAESHDFAALLGDALAQHRVSAMAQDLRPPLDQYQALRSQLSRYRALVANSTLPQIGETAPVRPGDTYADLGALQQTLVALGDLAAESHLPQTSASYDGATVTAVSRFQRRHGLQPDGVLGKHTIAALRTPLTWRVRQIELALERLRWLPDITTRRLVVINIPMFRLWAWDSIADNGLPALSMDVIVGRAVDARTPVFVERMRELVIRPYWNIPRSILQAELLPLLAHDLDYLQRERLEIVRGQDDDASPLEATMENVEALRAGGLRLRQRPGPDNALGLIKFVFPNDEHVYMHGTPEPELFTRSRRDFSHGCIRVQDPAALAEWALAGQPEWNRQQILASMAGASSTHIALPQPIEVVLFYTTAAVMPEDNSLSFAEDIYEQDRTLDLALAGRRSAK
ncbi:MAG: L,D-transpeptidase family protein [Vicinamibacterales bacterium]